MARPRAVIPGSFYFDPNLTHMPTGDGTRGRYDNRRRHDGKLPADLISPVKHLIKNGEQLPQPTPTRHYVDSMPYTPISTDKQLAMISEAIQRQVTALHAKSQKEFLSADDIEMLGKLTRMLLPIDKQTNPQDIDLTKLPLDALKKALPHETKETPNA